jgi:carboxyl-terminal processing protease
MAVGLLLGMLASALAFQQLQRWMGSRSPSPVPQGEIRLEALREVLEILDAEYFKSFRCRDLLNGAVAGLRRALKEAEIDPAALADLPPGDDLNLLWRAFQAEFARAEERASGKIPRADLIYAALEGMLSVLGDPYTVALTPDEYRRLDEQMSGGNFGGVGIYIEQDQRHSGRLTIVEPIEGSPAARAGLQPGDWIVRINDRDTAGMDTEEAASLIRGPVGTRVTLTLKRAGQEPFSVVLERQTIHVKSASTRMLPGQVAYIRLRFFGEDTRQEFAEALKVAQEQGARALILDLRGNGGGYVNAALDVCAHFVPPGKLVTQVVNPRTSRNEQHYSPGSRSPTVKIPLVVLVNNWSASASEITAGALKDHGLATLLGEKTFGKASVQAIHLLPDGGAVKYTVAHYLTPRGRDIHRQGIEPDIVVKLPEGEGHGWLQRSQDLLKDPQIQAALHYLEKRLAAGK